MDSTGRTFATDDESYRLRETPVFSGQGRDGVQDAVSASVGFQVRLDECVSGHVQPRILPFVIGETHRKFQHSLSEVTVWERRY